MKFPPDVKFSIREVLNSSLISYSLDIISESRYHLHLITDVHTKRNYVLILHLYTHKYSYIIKLFNTIQCNIYRLNFIVHLYYFCDSYCVKFKEQIEISLYMRIRDNGVVECKISGDGGVALIACHSSPSSIYRFGHQNR